MARNIWIVALIVLALWSSVMQLSNGIVTRPRPNQVPIGAEWLNSMPTGNDINPPATQPVREVNWKTCRPNVQVVEYLYASVTRSNLGRGTNTDAAIRDWVASIGQRGSRQSDDAGHIIGKNQGGLGTVHWNIFPQSQQFNRGIYAQAVEKVVNDAVSRNSNANMWFRFIYDDARYPCRPSKFYYFLLTTSFSLHDDLDNPYNP